VPAALSPLIHATPDAETLAAAYGAVRAASLALADGLAPEDTALQSMPDASPTKWHLAHTSWFFEQFVLGEDPDYQPVHAGWHYLFNSYYQSVGPMHARPRRGLLSRPSLAEVLDYRTEVDRRVQARLAAPCSEALRARITLGLHHEQQHQELILTDLQHLFSCNPLEPAYRAPRPSAARAAVPLRFLDGAEGIFDIGAGAGFAFDCETPRHRVLLGPHALANRPVNNAEYRAFIEDGGYRTPTLWLSEGWNRVQQDGWSRPLYWSKDLVTHFTLNGRQPLDPLAPVCHLSYFEADAYARWTGARLPTEAEWECAAAQQPPLGHYADAAHFRPLAPTPGEGLLQLFGDVWEWTASPYQPYPGYRVPAGALGEYNGKFMCGQFVLRGGSCATPAGHMRASYRNFFPPADRWQFSGLRLAQDR
jgi:ergothioneine biosynthesis protein EgtB